jgi:hypothetical protein
MIDVERSEEAVDVGEPGGWNKAFLTQLQEDFRGKCYLCESYVGPHFQVDHRYPKAEHPERITDRANLFPACGFCNQHRWKKARAGGFASPGENVEGRLEQWLFDDGRIRAAFRAKDPSDQDAVNTASELEHLHVGETPKRAALDKAIIDQTLRIRRAQQAWQASKDVKQEHALRMLLSRDAPFTALMRAEFHELSALFD